MDEDIPNLIAHVVGIAILVGKLAYGTPEQQATLESWRAMLSAKTGPNGHDGTIGDPENANRFSLFAEKRLFCVTCPAGEISNPQADACDLPENVSLDANPAPRDVLINGPTYAEV